MKGDPGANFPMRDVYVDTCQPHGGQGGAHLLSLPSHDKRTEDRPVPLEFPLQHAHAGRQGWQGPLLLKVHLANLIFTSEMTQFASPTLHQDTKLLTTQ